MTRRHQPHDRKSRSRRLGAAVMLAALVSVLAVTATPASAHPLGNFTVNRYARIEVSAAGLRVYYVLDEAEIPAFQERRDVAADPAAFADRRAADIGRNLSLVVDGVPAGLKLEQRRLTQPPGQGGLSTLRLSALYVAAVPGTGERTHRATFLDGNESDRIGWREVVVTARGDGRVVTSDAPSQDQSDELRRYPQHLLQSPLDRRAATFTFVPGTQPVAAVPLDGAHRRPSQPGGRFAGLVTRQDVTPTALAGMLFLALAFGATHALGPGHGKSVMAAYLVGTEGRRWDALLFGVVVSLMHTGAVLLLGLALFGVSRSTSVDRIYPALGLASGIAVAAIGAWLLRQRLRAAPGHGDHDHRHHEHEHASLAHHHHGHGHVHVSADASTAVVKPLSHRGLLVLAGSGAVIPSPSAVVALLGAFSVGQALLGLALVAAFSVGMAVTLTAVGVALVLGRDFVQRRGARLLRLTPLAGAAALVALGAFLSAQAVRSL